MNYPTNYTEAIADFESLSKDDKEPFLYAIVGYALYVSQNFEKLLMNIIWGNKSVNRKDETNQEMHTFFDKYEFGKYTMGRLVKEVKEILNLSLEGSNKLEQILLQRNFLVHNYFNANDRLLYVPNGYHRVIKDFLNFINDSNEFEIKLHEIQLEYLEKFGYTKEILQKKVDDEILNWAEAGIDDSYQSMKL